VDGESDYQVGPGRPLHTRFKKGQSGNPGSRSAKSLPVLLADALNETVVVMIDGRRKITKREAMAAQMVDKSESADLHDQDVDLQARCCGGIASEAGATPTRFAASLTPDRTGD
jgi:hypothetical protein